MSTTILPPSLPVLTQPSPTGIPRIVLTGNPNAGKTSLFNALTGLRAKTANFPGTTFEYRRGQIALNGRPVHIIDIPGLYSLDPVTPDERIACEVIEGRLAGEPAPDVTLVVVDATNLERNLVLAGQVLERRRPTVVALNMMDLADRQSMRIDVAHLEEELGCPVVAVSARTGRGIDQLQSALDRALRDRLLPIFSTATNGCNSCGGCPYAARFHWAEGISRSAVHAPREASRSFTERVDRLLTHRIGGLISFAAVMLLTFMLIFWIAQFPMGWIDSLFAVAGSTLGQWLPAGDFNSLVTDGLVGGVGGMLVFLPQICILFFMLALLEDSGYLARAALVMDKLMHRVGLPGKAFVPMLSAHACAIPAIMSTRVIEDRRDRLVTMLVLPLMTCSARVPVYAMVTALLFPHAPFRAAFLFAGAYSLGIFAALVMAWVFKKTILPGRVKPLVIELPNYRLPSLRNALLLTLDRGIVFIKNAGTVILVISLVLWALATYPKLSAEDIPAATATRIAQLEAAGQTHAAGNLLAQTRLEHSFAGRVGHAVEPVFRPLGFDWKMSVGVVSSLAAREVIVSTLAVLYGLGNDADDNQTSLYESLRASTRADGTPVFTVAACLSMLVFYVLAMQCLPTQAITLRESGSWKWPILQFAYMSLLAYCAALLTYQVAAGFGLA